MRSRFTASRRPILIDLIFEPDDFIAKNYAHIVHEKDQLIADTTLPRPQGRIVTLMGKASPLYDRQGEVIGAIESIRDITALKMVEEELRAANEQLSASQEELQSQFDALIQSEQQIRESEEKFRDLAEMLPQMIFEMDLNFRVTYANRYALRQSGSPRKTLRKGSPALSYIDPSDHDRVRENARRIVRGEPVENREYTAVRTDGTTFPVLIYTSPLYRDGKIDGFRGVIIDFTDRKRAESELRDAYEQIAATEEELRGNMKNWLALRQNCRNASNNWKRLRTPFPRLYTSSMQGRMAAWGCTLSVIVPGKYWVSATMPVIFLSGSPGISIPVTGMRSSTR